MNNGETTVTEQPEAGVSWVAPAVAAGALLGGCGGEGESGPAGGPAPTAQAVPWPDDSQAARFLGQAALGATADDLIDVTRHGYGPWLDAQMASPPSVALYDLAVTKGLTDHRYQASDVGLDNALWFSLFHATDPVRQRVVLALSEIFVVSARNMPIPFGHLAVLSFWDLLGRHCFGNFLDLLEAVTLSPAMGTYLSMRGSAKADASGRHPDENFAREVLQLFTIGLVDLKADGEPALDGQGRPRETYNHEVVSQLARVFTGWEFDAAEVDFTPATTADYVNRPMRFMPERHDMGEKWVLRPANRITAPPGRATVRQALQFIVAHPNVGPFLARQLIQRLVTSNPEPAHVARVAQAFQDNGQGVRGDMKAVLRAVLLDPLARLAELPAEQAARRGKLREPMLRLAHWGRLTQVTSSDDWWDAGNLSSGDKLAQGPMRAPSVFNFFRPGFMLQGAGPGGSTLFAPEFQITNESSVIGYANFLYEILPVGLGYSEASRIAPDYAPWDALAASPEALVDRLNLLLTGRTLSPTTLMVVRQAVASAQAADGRSQARNRVLAAFYLIMCSADYLVQR